MPEAWAPALWARARPPQVPGASTRVREHFQSPLLGRQGRELPLEWGPSPSLEPPGLWCPCPCS